MRSQSVIRWWRRLLRSAVQTGNDAITIQWTSVISSGTYLLQRATGSGGSYVSLPSVAAGQTSLIDNSLDINQPDTVFSYRIFSEVNGVQSTSSAVFQVVFNSDVTPQQTDTASPPSVTIPSADVAQVYEWDGTAQPPGP